MSTGIVKTLKLMCDDGNPQDKKLLLLAELVDTKYSEMAKNQEEMKQSIKATDEKLDKILDLFEEQQKVHRATCPINEANREGFALLSVLLSHPKLAVFVLLGVLALLLGVYSKDLINWLKFIL